MTFGRRTHTVQKGDTLVKLSERFYGTPNLALFVYEANRLQISNPNILVPRTVITIPYHESIPDVNVV